MTTARSAVLLEKWRESKLRCSRCRETPATPGKTRFSHVTLDCRRNIEWVAADCAPRREFLLLLFYRSSPRSPPSNLFNTTLNPPNVFVVKVGRLGRMHLIQGPCTLNLRFVHHNLEKDHQYYKNIPETSSAHPRSESRLTLMPESCVYHYSKEISKSDWSQVPIVKPTRPPTKNWRVFCTSLNQSNNRWSKAPTRAKCQRNRVVTQ